VPNSLSRRQFVTSSIQAAALATAGRFTVLKSYAQTSSTAYQSLFSTLDRFIEQYMRDMNAPGLTFAMADRNGVQRVASYGYSDVESKLSITLDQLFQIGSITKSFVAICLLQLHDEGKLDLQKPITDYLPWFRVESSFSPITTHHLLTHSAGIPGTPPVFLSDPSVKHRAANAPGAYFHYCNTGFELLGYLLWTLDGRPIGECLRSRIFLPLGMTQSEPIITLDIRDRVAMNYEAFQSDRPYPRYGRLSEAPGIISTDGAGCIASTPRDMALYAQMIANHGVYPKGRLVSEKSFALFSTSHIKAEELGPTAGYGYGIAVDMLDGHTILWHTGGMVSFASALQVDIDEGVGAFASINAMQGYRPNPVAQYAIQLMRAQRSGKSLPEAPKFKPPSFVENASQYAGVYTGTYDRKWEFLSEGNSLFLIHEGRRIQVETGIESQKVFTICHPTFDRFALTFGHAKSDDPKSPVVECAWGGDWFTNEKYTGPKTFDYPQEWNQFVGHYRNENPWIGSARIVVRKGKLMIDGIVPLEPTTDGAFYLRDEEHNPEWIRFADIVNGQSMRFKLSGEDMWRVMAD
jgi:CubicO group peptidase (beta-lactamase class C family)